MNSPAGSKGKLIILKRVTDTNMNALVITATRKLVTFFITLTLRVQQNRLKQLHVVKFIQIRPAINVSIKV